MLINAQRWDVERQHDLAGSPAVPFGGFLLAEPSTFDAEAFRLAATEAKHIDPQQRLLLECAAEATRGCAACCRCDASPLTSKCYASLRNVKRAQSMLSPILTLRPTEIVRSGRLQQSGVGRYS